MNPNSVMNRCVLLILVGWYLADRMLTDEARVALKKLASGGDEEDG